MTMKEKLKIHAEIEAADRRHRIWFMNAEILDKLTDAWPIDSIVENFGILAKVVGYDARGEAYTGDLILQDLETGLRWIGKTDFCRAS